MYYLYGSKLCNFPINIDIFFVQIMMNVDNRRVQWRWLYNGLDMFTCVCNLAGRGVVCTEGKVYIIPHTLGDKYHKMVNCKI